MCNKNHTVSQKKYSKQTLYYGGWNFGLHKVFKRGSRMEVHFLKVVCEFFMKLWNIKVEVCSLLWLY